MTEVVSPPPKLTFQRAMKPIVFVICLGPIFVLTYRGLNGQLGVNPIEYVIRYLGDWALRFLLIALAVTPMRVLTGYAPIGRLRRMLGLFAFTYVILHMLAYIGLDRWFDWAELYKDVVKRIYITVGMSAFAMLLPLAITSTDAMVRRLGARRWRRLHRLVYPAAIAAVIHYALMIKAGYLQPLIYAAILGLLLAARVFKKT